MRMPILLTALLAVAAAPGPCGPTSSPGAPNSVGPCAGQACGAECVVDPPCRSAVPPCELPSFVGRCDADGACVPPASCRCDDPCAGKRCGDPCQLCPPGALDCVETMVVKACDPAGRCVALTPDLGCPP